jgi:predicted N-acyltransferase
MDMEANSSDRTPAPDGMSERTPANYVIRIVTDPTTIDAAQWDGLQRLQPDLALNPFMRRHYLAAMHDSLSAVEETGWNPQFVTLWAEEQLVAACALYLKTHSYGEYVFDWAWARAYAENQMAYYPKAIVAAPFTPVPGPRLLATSPQAKQSLLEATIAHCETLGVSSLHVLFADAADIQICESAGLMRRETVQFHWFNQKPAGPGSEYFSDFDDFLSSLNQDKRKKIKQERRKVREAGVTFETFAGNEITDAHWALFYECYERTYLEHGNAPYLTPAFFESMRSDMPENWVMFVAKAPDGTSFATSLIGLSRDPITAQPLVAYGRYWGALKRVDCLHFEACYYQPIAWCIANGVSRFEGGAQGEHKMARALMPVRTFSAHWLAHPAFAAAVNRYLERERDGIQDYVDHLGQRNPFKGIAG